MLLVSKRDQISRRHMPIFTCVRPNIVQCSRLNRDLAAVMYCFVLQWWGKDISPRTHSKMYFVLFQDVTDVLCNVALRDNGVKYFSTDKLSHKLY